MALKRGGNCRKRLLHADGVLFAVLGVLICARVAAAKPALVECLEDAGVYTLTGNNTEYYSARQVFSKLFSHWPSAIAYPSSTKQVQACVKCAAKFKVVVHPRCGGHSNEGECMSTGALTVDLTKMADIKLAKDRKSVMVQAGARVGQVVAALWEASNGTLGYPAGQRPVVGVSGYSLGGGFGATTRWAGLAADNIISLTAVDGRGRVVKASATENTDLLWASRGGGGGRFAIITEFEFRTMDVSTGVIMLTALIPRARAVQTLAWFQGWQATLPSRFTMRADYAEDKEGKVSIELTGWCMGSEEVCAKELGDSLPADGPIKDSEWKLVAADLVEAQRATYLEAAVDGIGWPVPAGYTALEALATPTAWDEDRSYYKYKTIILHEPLSDEGIRAVLDYASHGPRGTRVFEFQGLGGVMNDVPTDATAAANLRGAKLILIMRANSKNKNEAYAALHHATIAITKLVDLVPKYQAYLNFLDTDIAALGNWEASFYGDALPGLSCVNDKYDPNNLFRLPFDFANVDKPTASECKALLAKNGARAAAWSKYLRSNAPARG